MMMEERNLRSDGGERIVMRGRIIEDEDGE